MKYWLWHYLLAPRRERPPMPRNAETRLLVIGCNGVEHNDDHDDTDEEDMKTWMTIIRIIMITT